MYIYTSQHIHNLRQATHSGKTPILKLLVEKGANLNAKARSLGDEQLLTAFS